MQTGTIKIAACQFEVSGSIEQNAESILSLMEKAGEAKVEVVHFSECALSGYAGANHENLKRLDWELLKEKTLAIMSRAGELGVWVVLGSTHRLTGPNKPHNSLYLINPQGQIETRYDKRFCTIGDLDHYSPGNRFVKFTINGVVCSLLICFDLRFPELYRQLKKMGVQCIFQSFYNAGAGEGVHTQIMRQTMQSHAGTNAFWISMVNTSGPKSPYPSCFIQPDGVIVNHLNLNEPGFMINTVDITRNFYDPAKPFRRAAIEGALSNGPALDDPRSAATDII